MTERDGVWGKATAVPGLTALNTGRYAAVDLMSCRSAGNCTATGNYAPRHGNGRGFVVSEKDGTWGKAEPIRGLAAPASAPSANALSCGSPGNCTIGGIFETKTGSGAFTVTQTDGTWAPAQAFPAIPAAAKFASIGTLSCRPDGGCAGTGFYQLGGQHFFAISRTAGTWGAPVPIPGFAALPYADGGILSCPSPGNCTLSGDYYSHGGSRLFTASQENGTWGRARPLPGIAALHAGKYVQLSGLACLSAGDCTAAGNYLIQHNHYTVAAVFVTAEKNGTWGKPQRVPGSLASLGTNVTLTALSCGAPGDCNAAGNYGPESDLPFVVTQKNGTWGKARPLRGIRP